MVVRDAIHAPATAFRPLPLHATSVLNMGELKVFLARGGIVVLVGPGRPLIRKEAVRPAEADPATLVLKYDESKLDAGALGASRAHGALVALLRGVQLRSCRALDGPVEAEAGDGGRQLSDQGASPQDGSGYAGDSAVPGEHDCANHQNYAAHGNDSQRRHGQGEPKGRDDEQAHKHGNQRWACRGTGGGALGAQKVCHFQQGLHEGVASAGKLLERLDDFVEGLLVLGAGHLGLGPLVLRRGFSRLAIGGISLIARAKLRIRRLAL